MEVKKFTDVVNEDLEDKSNIREILPQMVGVSNNSRLTTDVANTLIEKFTKNEIRDFKEWLKLIENKNQSTKNRYF